MSQHHLRLIGLAAALAATPALADTATEALFLQPFAGTFTGSGRVVDNVGGSARNLDCTFNSTIQGTSMNFDGTCRTAVVVSVTLNIALKADGQGRYTGNYRDSTGNTATLSGQRRGTVLPMVSRDTDSPHPPAKLTIDRKGTNLSISLRRQLGDKARNVSIALRKS